MCWGLGIRAVDCPWTAGFLGELGLKWLIWYKLHQQAGSPVGGFLLPPHLYLFYMSKIFQPNLTRVSNLSNKLGGSKWSDRVEEILTHGFTLYYILDYEEKEQSIQESIGSVLVCVRRRRICEIGAREKPASTNSAACETVCFNYGTLSTHWSNFLVVLGLVNIELYLSN